MFQNCRLGCPGVLSIGPTDYIGTPLRTVKIPLQGISLDSSAGSISLIHSPMRSHFFLANELNAALIQNFLVLLASIDQGVGAQLVDFSGTSMGVFLDLADRLIREDIRL